MKEKEYFVFFKDLVTQTKNGIMRKEDKKKLDGIDEGANKTIVDSVLDKTSQNPVENKVIATEIETLKKSGSDGKKKVADAITGMGVTTATDADFDTITGNIEKIGGDTTISAGDVLSGKVAYAKGKYITGSMPNNGAKTAALDCGESYNIPAGYHNGAGRVSANSLASQTGATAAASDILSGKTAYVNGSKITGNIPSKAAATYTPSTQDQEIAAKQYLSGKQTIKGDANLAAGKIKKGVSIFGVAGSFTEDANAVAADILKEKTAYVNGSKITGNIPSKAAAIYTPGTTNQEIAAGQYLSGKQTIKGDANLLAANIKKGVSIFGVNGNLEANNINSLLGKSILDRFSNVLSFSVALSDVTILNEYDNYKSWYVSMECSHISGSNSPSRVVPKHDTDGGAIRYPKESYFVFESGHILHLYLHRYTSPDYQFGDLCDLKSEWLDNNSPPNYSVEIVTISFRNGINGTSYDAEIVASRQVNFRLVTIFGNYFDVGPGFVWL